MLALMPNGWAGSMPTTDKGDMCPFCRKGRVVERTEEIAFHQWTDKGYVFCRVKGTLGVCDRCGSRDWNDDTEALIEAAVRREYDKLP
jgi:hypothetical protein